MKLLLDENLPKRLKKDFTECEVYTVRDMGWNGKKNGELLQLMLLENFTILITFDKNLRYQQNFIKYPIPEIVLNAKDNTYITLSAMVIQVKELLKKDIKSGVYEIKEGS